MRLSSVQAALGSALVLLADHQCSASAAHQKAHQQVHQQLAKRHAAAHGHAERQPQKPWEPNPEDLVGMPKRTSLRCPLPNDPDLVVVTPSAMNEGWAMSPDQPCTAGTWCPIACKAGKVMAQWEPNSTYTYPASMVRAVV
jgi:hypothetical protein